ncbi:CBS domain-containing protein [Desulfocurvus sp.]|jgi:CBS domain-containing protein|uniref:CBS domain-containing protein n=1 Tax=Desulfocurvus sp. TaxID=2871698 RepID=UPI0025BCCE27|nr:CBS domain-containing protein [Desulfocurvus sp.]MCK9239061.1 CBS domain-containing protein [Desulfocurvus sp.]
MLKAKDIMTAEPVTLAPDTDIATAARTLLDTRVNGLPVVDASGALVGVLCQSDLVAQQKTLRLPSVFTLLDGLIPLSSTRDLEREMERIAALTVGQAMSPDPVTVAPDAPISEVATLMVDRKFHTIPVVDGGRLVGVIGKEDILRTLLDARS